MIPIPLLLIGVHQLAAVCAEQVDRNRKYEMALTYATSVGKPLLVAGGPYGNP